MSFSAAIILIISFVYLIFMAIRLIADYRKSRPLEGQAEEHFTFGLENAPNVNAVTVTMDEDGINMEPVLPQVEQTQLPKPQSVSQDQIIQVPKNQISEPTVSIQPKEINKPIQEVNVSEIQPSIVRPTSETSTIQPTADSPKGQTAIQVPKAQAPTQQPISQQTQQRTETPQVQAPTQPPINHQTQPQTVEPKAETSKVPTQSPTTQPTVEKPKVQATAQTPINQHTQPQTIQPKAETSKDYITSQPSLDQPVRETPQSQSETLNNVIAKTRRDLIMGHAQEYMCAEFTPEAFLKVLANGGVMGAQVRELTDEELLEYQDTYDLLDFQVEDSKNVSDANDKASVEENASGIRSVEENTPVQTTLEEDSTELTPVEENSSVLSPKEELQSNPLSVVNLPSDLKPFEENSTSAKLQEVIPTDLPPVKDAHISSEVKEEVYPSVRNQEENYNPTDLDDNLVPWEEEPSTLDGNEENWSEYYESYGIDPDADIPLMEDFDFDFDDDIPSMEDYDFEDVFPSPDDDEIILPEQTETDKYESHRLRPMTDTLMSNSGYKNRDLKY